MTKIERHLFVCEHARPLQGKPSCGARGSGELLAALQEELGRHPDLWGRVAITPAGCLGLCFEGPTLVVYPEAVWYVGVRREDAREIVERHLRAGQVVERLVYRPPEED